MSDQDYLKEELDYLRKRSWDLTSKLEALEAEYKETVDADKRQSLENKINKNKKLLKIYIAEYNELCEEAGFTQEMLTPNVVRGDIISSVSQKTAQSEKNLTQKEEKIELAAFHNIPSRNKQFTGRKDEVREFIGRVLDGGAFAICGVKGMGGIGKTEIAREVCHLFHDTWAKNPQLPDYVADLLGSKPLFADGILWIQFERDNQSPKVLTQYILNKITDSQTAEKIADLSKLAEILAAKDVLVVLDSVEQNLRTFDYVHEIFRGRFPLIITSRVEILGIHAVDIDVLKPEEAFDLFVAQLPCSEEDLRGFENLGGLEQEIKDLCAVLGHFPLAIKIIASRVDADLGNIAALTAAFQDKSLLLEEKGSGLELEQRNIDVKTCFMMSFNELDDFEQQVFKHCAIFNNPFEVINLADLLGEEDEAKIAAVVAKLVKFSLLNRSQVKDSEAVSYDLHPLMREFALNLLMQSVEVVAGKKQEIEDLLERLEQAKEEVLLVLLQDKAVLQQIIGAMNYCDSVFDFATVKKLMDKTDNALDRLGCWQEKIELNHLAIRANIALQNKSSETFCRLALADTLHRKATIKIELEESASIFKKVLTLCQELNVTDKILFVQYVLSYIQKHLGKFTNSIISNYEGTRLADKYNNLYNHARFNKTNAEIHNVFLQEKTFLEFKVNFKIKKENSQENWSKQNLLRAYSDVIDTQFNKGKIQSCIPYYQKRLQIAEKLQDAESVLEAIKSLFNCFSQSQQHKAVQLYLQAYFKLSTAMGLAEEQRLKLTAQAAYLEANYKTATQQFSKILPEESLNQEEINYWLGKCYLRDDNLDQAEQHLNETLTFYQQQKNAHQIANVYIELALLALKRNQLETALTLLGIALKTKQSLDCLLLPEQESVKQTILAKLKPEDADYEKYQDLITDAEPLNLIPDFILQNLPATHTAKDNKQMLLIPEGSAYVGKGEITDLSIEEILDNIDSYFEDNDDEKQETATEIYLYPYYIDQTTVTNAEYQNFCLATEHPQPEHWQDDKIPENTAHLPVVNISLDDAKAYAKWAGKELPTVMEWEKACRGEHGLVYPWGNEWDDTQVKAKGGDTRKNYENEFEALNQSENSQGILGLKKETHLFKIPLHPNTTFDEENFLNLLEGSISLTLEEKQRVIEAIPRISIEQINELINIFTEEIEKFSELETEFSNDVKSLKRKRFDELNQASLFNLAVKYLNSLEENQSPYGVYNMVGNIYEMTETEEYGKYHIKGGSWFSENPHQECQAWAKEPLKKQEKRIDVGFRCVKPIFSNADIEALSKE